MIRYEQTVIQSSAMRYIELQGLCEATSTYPSNSIITSKYTKLSFLPKALLVQFGNVAMIWFLLISILELTTINQNVSLNVGTIIPLLLLLLIKLLREAWNDYLRHVSDNSLNNSRHTVWNGKEFGMKLSKDIQVGDLLLIYDEDYSPADVLIVASGNQGHECYVEASAIYGEASLRIKHAVKETQMTFDTIDLEEACLRMKLLNEDLFVCLPNPDFRNFSGRLKMHLWPKSSKVEMPNVILRGMKITHTPWVIAVVLYTGAETKVWINNLQKRTKNSRLLRIVDNWILCMLPIIALVCVVNTIAASFVAPVHVYSWQEILSSNVVLFGHMIPISLMLSIEITRGLHSFIIQRNSQVRINSANLFSNLGMVEYIVADKTGTLTENDLKIGFCTVVDKVYWDREPRLDDDNEELDGEYKKIPSMQMFDVNEEILTFADLEAGLANFNEDHAIFNYVLCMALSNFAFPRAKNEYGAILVDDREMAYTAARIGIKLIDRTSEYIIVSVFGSQIQFDVLGFVQFSSAKKISRVMVRDRESGNVSLFVKGCREVMIDLYSEEHGEDEIIEGFRTIYMGFKDLTKKESKNFLLEYATAKKSPVDVEGRIEAVFQKYDKKLEYLGYLGLEDSISEDTINTVKTMRNAGLKFWLLSGDSEESTLAAAKAANLYQPLDKVLHLTNLRSELQFLDVIQGFIQTGIFEVDKESPELKTNNKRNSEKDIDIYDHHEDTSRNSKRLSGTLFLRKTVISIRNTVKQSIGNRSDSRLHFTAKRTTVNPIISRLTVKPRTTNLHQSYSPDKLHFILSIDGTGLDYALTSKLHTKYFMTLIFGAKFACFHSLYPDHKKKVVQMLKSNFSFRPLVLSVGDGISDIGMIHEADIGIGIEGKEGLDAANSSDISIQHFSQLKELLLIDGHRQYIQLSKMVLLSWYAMALVETLLFIYNCLTQFTAYSLLQKEYVTVYRLVVSIVPLAGMCLLDKDSSSTVITPQAYKVGIFNTMLTARNVIIFSVIGIMQAVVTFTFTQLTFAGISQEGFTESELIIGSSMATVVFSTVLISVFIETYCISPKTLLVYVITLMLCLAACVPLAYANTELSGNLSMMGQYSTIWIYIVFTVAINASISYFFKCSRYLFYPGILEMIRSASPESSLRKKSRVEFFRKSLKKVFRASSRFQNNIVHDTEKINEKIMKFSSEFREILYQTDKKTENKMFNYIFLFIGSIGVLAYTIYTLSIPPTPHSSSNIIFCVIVTLALMSVFFFPSVIRYQKYSSIYLSVALLGFQLFFFLSEEVFDNYSRNMYCFIPVLYLIGFSNHWLEITISVALGSIFVIIDIVLATVQKLHVGAIESAEIIVSYIVVYISICSVASIAAYFIDKSGRIEFNLVQKVQIEIHKTKSVLGYLLPAFVRKRVKNGVRYIVEDQGIVSIIFCDIYNFEEILKHYQPQELTAFLDDLFAKIDQKCSLSGCTKIETVGKTYMACAGLKDSENEQDQNFTHVSHARRTVEMGISILNLCESIYLKNGDTLKVKIGINSGPVTAGVVGYHKPQFSLVGDTVNTASRMASLCPAPNNIQISTDTFKYLDDTSGLQLTPFNVVAKGKGQMSTYLVSIFIKELGTSFSISPIDIGIIGHTPSKKLTLRNYSPLKEPTKRRSSMIENLNEAILDEAGEFKKNETQQLDEIKCFSFGCSENHREETLRKECSETNLFVSKAGLKIRIFCDAVILFFALLESVTSSSYQVYTITKLFAELFLLLLVLLRFNRDYKQLYFSWILGSIYLVGGALRLFDYSQDYEVVFIDYLLYMLQAALCSQLLFNTLSWCISIVACIQIIACTTTPNESVHLNIISSIIFLATLFCTIYSRERKLRIFSRIKLAAEKELNKTEELLTKMMPGNVLAKLKEQNHVTEYIHGVSILFADIAGFTQWSSEKLPGEVVGMLSNLFTEFDYKCVQYEVYKVHTIGDCYVALGYTGNKARSEVIECYNLAKFALDLVQTIQDVNAKHGISLGMRIGMHTGDIIGGIAGTNIIRYDIYGSDVLLANKMESTGKVGKVHVSQQTMKILKKYYPKEFKFEEAEKIMSPITETEVPTYFLEKYGNGLVAEV